MKNFAVVFLTSGNGDQLQADINAFIKKHDFVLMNVSYNCYYIPDKNVTVHNALVTYQYLVPVRSAVPGVEVDSISILQ